MIALAENRNIIPSQEILGGGLCMGFNGGSVQRHGNRFYVQLYWNKTTEKFWSVLIQGQWHPIKSYENGDKGKELKVKWENRKADLDGSIKDAQASSGKWQAERNESNSQGKGCAR
jgi:hypothetical protein